MRFFFVLVFYATFSHAQFVDFSHEWDMHPAPDSANYSGYITFKVTDAAQVSWRDTYVIQSQIVSRVPSLRGNTQVTIQPTFSRDREEMRLRQRRVRRRTPQRIPDATTFYTLHISEYTAATNLLSQLRDMPEIEIAYAEPLPQPPPSTPDLTEHQHYLGSRDQSTRIGYDVTYAWKYPGTDGAHVRVIDIEYAWTLDHQDLRLPPSTLVWGQMYTGWGYDHGTASLGCIMARATGFGMKGIAYNTDVRVISPVQQGIYRLADAIDHAVLHTQPGDVILLEQQASDGDRFVPVEFHPAVYTAIATAAADNRLVIVPAANGSANLDDTNRYGQIFQRSYRDSGAIYVGAGTARHAERASFSGYGSRVDIQGWGDWTVATAGYGGLFGTHATNEYTATFSGTSSASALTAGVVASLQSYAIETFGTHLPPHLIRSNLVVYGIPQHFGRSGHIGPLPNLSNSVVNLIPEPTGLTVMTLICVWALRRCV